MVREFRYTSLSDLELLIGPCLIFLLTFLDLFSCFIYIAALAYDRGVHKYDQPLLWLNFPVGVSAQRSNHPGNHLGNHLESSVVGKPRITNPPPHQVTENAKENPQKKQKRQSFIEKTTLLSSNNTSGYIGVTLPKHRKRYQAYIYHEGKRETLGMHDTAREGALAYDKKAIGYRRQLSKLNFPEMVPHGYLPKEPKKRPLDGKNTTGYRGVSKKTSKGHQAQIHLSGKNTHIGYFETVEEDEPAKKFCCSLCYFSSVGLSAQPPTAILIGPDGKRIYQHSSSNNNNISSSNNNNISISSLSTNNNIQKMNHFSYPHLDGSVSDENANEKSFESKAYLSYEQICENGMTTDESSDPDALSDGE
jgi:hypothetical protein